MKNGDYNLVVAPDWYRGKRYRGNYCYEHHLVWEQEYGIPVPDGYIIHHRDGNKRNNRIDNLELIKKEVHSKMHADMQKKTMAILRCPYCKKIFERDVRWLHYKRMLFCGRHCVGKYWGSRNVDGAKAIKDASENLLCVVEQKKFVGV